MKFGEGSSMKAVVVSEFGGPKQLRLAEAAAWYAGLPRGRYPLARIWRPVSVVAAIRM
jgi:hypothetical protein